jgi:hypothetical protein
MFGALGSIPHSAKKKRKKEKIENKEEITPLYRFSNIRFGK